MELRINDRFVNRKVEYFNGVSVDLSHNTLGGTFSLQYRFKEDNREQIELSCVSHFHEVQILHQGVLLITGVITNNSFTQNSESNLVTLSGHSLPGVLEYVQIPPSIYPLQSDGLTIAQIAKKLINPFNLKMVIDKSVSSKMNTVLSTTEASNTQSIKDYLSTLCKDKNIIMSHNEKGELFFTSSKTDDDPLFEWDLTKESPRGISFDFNYDGSSMNSHITILKEKSPEGGNSGQFTIRNPYVIGSYYKPKVMTQTSGDDNSTSQNARRELGNQLKGVSLKIQVQGWDIDGVIVVPNNTITIIAPKLYIFRKEKFFIESVNYSVSAENSPVMTLNCVLPEVYNDEPIVNIFRGINLHPL